MRYVASILAVVLVFGICLPQASGQEKDKKAENQNYEQAHHLIKELLKDGKAYKIGIQIKSNGQAEQIIQEELEKMLKQIKSVNGLKRKKAGQEEAEKIFRYIKTIEIPKGQQPKSKDIEIYFKLLKDLSKTIELPKGQQPKKKDIEIYYKLLKDLSKTIELPKGQQPKIQDNKIIFKLLKDLNKAIELPKGQQPKNQDIKIYYELLKDLNKAIELPKGQQPKKKDNIIIYEFIKDIELPKQIKAIELPIWKQPKSEEIKIENWVVNLAIQSDFDFAAHEALHKRVLKKYDQDGYGQLSQAEKNKFKRDQEEAFYADEFNKFDKDGDGKLNRQEWATYKISEAKKGRAGQVEDLIFLGTQSFILNGSQNIKPYCLKRFDKNGDGKLDKNETKRMNAAKKKLLAKFDFNGDGKVDAKEKQWIHKFAGLNGKQLKTSNFNIFQSRPIEIEWSNGKIKKNQEKDNKIKIEFFKENRKEKDQSKNAFRRYKAIQTKKKPDRAKYEGIKIKFREIQKEKDQLKKVFRRYQQSQTKKNSEKYYYKIKTKLRKIHEQSDELKKKSDKGEFYKSR